MTNWNKLKREVMIGGIHIDSVIDKSGHLIEPKIKSLVLALNYKGYKTTGSCEGHTLAEREDRLIRPDREVEILFRAPHGFTAKITDKYGTRERTVNESPWVDIKSRYLPKRLISVLSSHYERTGIGWRLNKYVQRKYRLETIPRYDLATMQNDILELAEDIMKSQ